MEQWDKRAKQALVVTSLFALMSCSLLPQQFDEAKKDPDLACATFRPKPAQVPLEASKEVASTVCGGRYGCVTPSVESITYDNKGASVTDLGWLSCPASVRLSSGQEIHGAVNLYLQPYESSLRFTWTNDYKSTLDLRSPSEAKEDEVSSKCSASALVFSYAANFRDTGISPQENFRQMRIPPFKSNIQDAALKKIINSVYFDPDLSRLSPSEIYSTIFTSCRFPSKRYTPIK